MSIKKYADSAGLTEFWTKVKNLRVQSNWNESDTTSYAYIANKPTIPTVPSNVSAFTNDAGYITSSAIPASSATPTANRISKFDASSHMNSADMSSADITNFVNSLDVQGSKIVDYIVEDDVITIGDVTWAYRKWNSGRSECWGKISWTITTWTAWGSDYYSNYSGEFIFPSIFVSDPIITSFGNLSSGDAWLANRSWSFTPAMNLPTYFFMRSSTGSTNITGYVHVYIQGRWK